MMVARLPLLTLSSLLLGLSLSQPAAADDDKCAIQVPSVQPDPVVALYDPFNAIDAEERFTIDVRTADCPPRRNVFLELDPVDPTALSGDGLLLTGPGGTQILVVLTDDKGKSAHGRDEFFNVEAGLNTLEVRVPRGQVVPPGDYRTFMIARTRLNNGNNEPEAIENFELIVRVGAAIGLLPRDGSRLELGELKDGDRANAAVTFDAYANVPYRLSLLSDLGFKLRLGGLTTSAGPDYVPLLDENLIPLTSPYQDFARPAVSEWRRRHSLDVEVGSIAGLPAGSYRDTITVEVSARLGE